MTRLSTFAATAAFALSTLAAPRLATDLTAQQRRVVNPPGTPTHLPFNNGVIVGNQLWVAGMEGEVNGNVRDETRTALEKIKSVVDAAGFKMTDVVAVQVYLADINDFPAMNEVYRTFFPDPKPTRTTVEVARLVNDAKVEITVTAVKTP